MLRLKGPSLTLKSLKNERRTSLLSTTLDDLMEIVSEGPPFESFSTENAVTLWYRDSIRSQIKSLGKTTDQGLTLKTPPQI